MTDIEELRRLAEMADAVAPTGWEADRERMTDAPDKHHEFFAIDGAGNRMFGTENADAAFGLIEVEDDGDGFTDAWNENSRRVIEFAVAAQPTTILSILDRLERAEAEAARLRGLLAEAGKALQPFARVKDLNIPNQPWIRQVPVFDEVISTIWTSRYRSARTVATKIEEALTKEQCLALAANSREQPTRPDTDPLRETF